MDREMLRALRSMVAPLERRLMLVASKFVLSLAKDGRAMQGAQGTALDSEVLDDHEHMQPGGLTHVAVPGAEGVFLTVGGARDDGVVICVSNRGNRPKNLAQGDTCVYSASATQAKIFVRASGDIEVQAATGRQVKMSASGNPTQAYVNGTAFIAALKTWLAALDVITTAPTPTAPQIATYEAASTAFSVVLNSTALSTVIKGE